MDLNDDLDPLFSKFRPEAVIHQAAHASVAVSVREPAFDATQNILGSINLLEACRRHDVKRVVYASSGAAYGEPKSLPLVEDQIVEPVSPYGVSKYVIEHYLRCYAHGFGIRSVALRYANVYGPRQDPYGEAGVISIFTDKLLRGERPTIFGDGEQTRDFVYVGDIAAANIAALEQDPDGPHPAVFNVSVNKQTSVNDLFKTLCRAGGFKIEAIYGDPRPGDVLHARLDNSRLKKALNWSPHVELEDGLRRTVEFFRNAAKK
jgi:UDP-glucose 4-epimerase